MKNIKKLTAIGCLAAIITIAACRTHFETMKASFTATRTPEAFERGKNLVLNICADCHYDKNMGKFIGMQMHDVPAALGKVYSANLTHSQTHGIPPHYTDAQLQYLFKTGIMKDGRFATYMLRPNMADEDINAIIVFLRSDDPSLAATDTTVGITQLNLIGRIGTSLTGKPVPYRTGIKRPDENDGVANGRYLVDNVGCYHCHSNSFTSLNYRRPELSKGYMAGGLKFKDKQGNPIYASNLTPDKQTGIGNYTKNDFRKAVQDGEAPLRHLRIPMPQFRNLSDRQVDAIYAYLQSIPPKQNEVSGHQ